MKVKPMTTLTIDMQQMLDFLIGLLEIPSPTGYHREVMPYVRASFENLDFPGLQVESTRKGALLITIPGQSDEQPVGLTAHVDTLGFMVTQVNGDGTLSLTNLGGINWAGAEFENCTIRTADDRRYRGTVILENPSTHVNRRAATQERNADSMVVRVDARTESKADTEALGIGVGDFIFLDPRVELTDTGFLRSRFLDDKASVACILGALQALKASDRIPQYTTYVLIANYEEVGHGGAAGFPADMHELVALDMGALGDGQNGDEYSVSICVKDSGGPYHFDLNEKLRALANDNHIAHKVDIYPYYASDGTAFWRAGGDARVSLIGPGVASSHGYERTHRDALENTAHLIARYLLSS